MPKQSAPGALEKFLEFFIFNCRWVLAPFYLGLAFSILFLLVKFVFELVHIAMSVFAANEIDVILAVLTLVDLTLIGSLLVIVIFAGYENFVSKIDFATHPDWPAWMGTIDFSALKLKLLSSIVAISAIELLKRFMSMKSVGPEDEKVLLWLVIIHMVFVVSSVLLALSDKIAASSVKSKKSA